MDVALFFFFFLMIHLLKHNCTIPSLGLLLIQMLLYIGFLITINHYFFFFPFSFIFIIRRLITLQYCSVFFPYIVMNQPEIIISFG